MKNFIIKNKKKYIIIYIFIIILLSFILNISFLKATTYSASITYIPEEYQLNNDNLKETNNVNNNKKNIKQRIKQKIKKYVENQLKNEENITNNNQEQIDSIKETNPQQSNQNDLNQQKTFYLNQQYTQPTIITNKEYYNLTLDIFDINKNPIYSTIEIKGQKENNNKTINTSNIKLKLEKDALKITITPLNKNYQTLIIEGNLNKDTELKLALVPKEFNIIFNISDLNSNKINDINYNIIVNSIVLTKLIKKENNKLFYNLIKNPPIKTIKLDDLSEYNGNNNDTLIPNNFQLSILSKGYKNEKVNFKINPNALKFNNLTKSIILEKNFYIEHILPFIYLSLLVFLSLISLATLYYKDKIKELLNKLQPNITQHNKVIKTQTPRNLKDTILKTEQLNTVSQIKINSEITEDNPKVSDYVLLEKLGTGATAVVYKAINIKTKNLVALKMIHKHLLSEDIVKERIENEIEINKLLSHPNIVKLVDYNLDDNPPYIAFEYIDGKSLDKILKEKKKLNIYETINIWMQILEALDYAHQKGIVHRDLKPENILIKYNNNSNDLSESVAKITDFGISKIINKTLNITQDFVGTPWYMSPEQIKGQKVDQRSDIYSLGIIIFQLLTGKLPFGESDNIYAVFKAHMLDNPIDSHILEGNTAYIPPDIEKIIRKMLEKNPKKRYQMVNEIINDLKPHFIKYSTSKANL